MRWMALSFLLFASTVWAGPFGLVGRRSQSGVTPANHGGFFSAQGAANHMASILRIGHFGGNPGYEGVGMGSTPSAAEFACCYRNRWAPREVGLAQGSNGMWFACCRY